MPESTKKSTCFASCFVLSSRCFFRCETKYLKDIKTINYFWLLKYAWIVVLGHYLFLEAHSCSWASLSKTVRFLEQILSSDNYPCIFQKPKVVYFLFIVQITNLPVFRWTGYNLLQPELDLQIEMRWNSVAFCAPYEQVQELSTQGSKLAVVC